MDPARFQKLDTGSPKFALDQVQNLHPNNYNLNNTNATTTNRENVVVDFKKLKEKGEEKMLAIKEQLRDLEFEEKFIEQILKEYSPKKIEEKLDLLMERRNIQNPAGWLMAALKNDYQDVEEERYDEEPAEGSGDLVNTPEWTSREKALKAIKLIKIISLPAYPLFPRGRVPE